MAEIRRATEADIPAITEIYNHAVLNTVATFDVEAKSIEDRLSWFRRHGPKHPVMVAEHGGRVVGWASLSEWSERCAYEDCLEISLYVDVDHRSRGIGRRLFELTIDAGKQAGVRTIIARIAAGNEASIHLCEATGFRYIGVMRQAGRKFGKILDVELYQLLFYEGETGGTNR